MRSSILNPRSSTLFLLGALLVIPAIAQGQTKLRASYAGTTGYHLPIWAQKQEGLDKQYRPDEESRKFYADNFTDIPRTETSGWRNLIATLGKSKSDMSRFLDMSLLDELQREGFFERIGK